MLSHYHDYAPLSKACVHMYATFDRDNAIAMKRYKCLAVFTDPIKCISLTANHGHWFSKSDYWTLFNKFGEK